jgi:hypothetical protein
MFTEKRTDIAPSVTPATTDVVPRWTAADPSHVEMIPLFMVIERTLWKERASGRISCGTQHDWFSGASTHIIFNAGTTRLDEWCIDTHNF